eukprot:GHVT01041102.1.p1 GENE.GHVT01041102.1~~GHVT01041102.1.p1  ORF type:complete len:190 (+),score=40.85 GHVT01041102.1:643-1212(+)
MSVPRRVVPLSNAEPKWTAATREKLTTFLIHAEKKGRISRAALKGFAAITNAPMPIVERKAIKILRSLRRLSSPPAAPPAAPQVAPWIKNLAWTCPKKSTQQIADFIAYLGPNLVEGYDALPEEEKHDKLRVAMNRSMASVPEENKLEKLRVAWNRNVERAESQAASVKTEVKKENARTKRPASKRGKK